MALTQKVLSLAAGLALFASVGCSDYNKVYKDESCTLWVNEDQTRVLMDYRADGICAPEKRYEFEVDSNMKPLNMLLYKDDKGCFENGTKLTEEFDPFNRKPFILSILGATDSSYAKCRASYKKSLK